MVLGQFGALAATDREYWAEIGSSGGFMENLAQDRILDQNVVATREGNVSCDLSGEVVILNLQEGMYYGLNSVGANIWKLIRTPRTVAEIRQYLLEEYDVEPEQCDRELRTLLGELVSKRLIEIRSDNAF